jgi:preprotein translocase subunit SecE
VNREYKRAMKKQEEQKKSAPRQVKPAGAPQKKERTKPRVFVREVVAEMKKVAWPSRTEVFAYSIVVLISVVIVAAIIFGMDFVFTKAVLSLFGVDV